MGFLTMDAYDPDHSSGLMSLPPEIRQQIYTYLFADNTLKPTPPLTATATTPLRKQPYTHPCLALLAASRLVHAEAYPHLVRAASLVLRTPADYARLSSPPSPPPPPSPSSSSSSPQDHPDHQQQEQKKQSHLSKPDVLPNLDRCCRPALAEVQRIVLAWPLLCAWNRSGEAETILGFGLSKSPLQRTQRQPPQAPSYDQVQDPQQMVLPRLRELALRDIAVGVVHARLCQLWTARRGVGGCAGDVDGNEATAATSSERGLLLVQGLMCELSPTGCDLLLATLNAARGRFRVEMAWAVKCSTCGLLPESHDESQDWQVQLQHEGAALGDVGCPIGTVGVEVGIEL